MRLFFLFLAFFLATAPGSAALAKSAPKAEKIDVRPVYNPDGSFGFCLGEKIYEDGRKLTLAYSPRDEINLGLSIPHAGFEKNARYDLNWSLDDKPSRAVRAIALSPEELLLQMGANAATRKNLAGASRLTVGGGGQTVRFELPSMPDLFARIQRCLKKSQNEKASAEPPGDTFPKGLSDLLTAAGETPFTPLEMKGVPVDQRPADYIWQHGKILGGIRERAAPSNPDLSDLVGLHLQGLKEKCDGTFSANIEKEQTGGKLRLRRADAGCTPKKGQSGEEIDVALLLYLTPNGGFTVITHEGTTESKKDAQAARDKMAQLLLNMAAEAK